MKIYYFIAAVAVCAFLTSCSNDDQENFYQKEFETQSWDSNSQYIINNEGDSIFIGDPYPPKPKG